MTCPRPRVGLGLMAVLLFLATGCGKSEQELAREARDARVIAEVRGRGGETWLCEPGDGVSDWRYIGAVTAIRFHGCDLWETNLADILPADTIESVDFSRCVLGDHHARQLANLPHLRHVYLDDTDVTDEAVRLLCQLPELDLLSLRHCQITDAAAVHLAQAKKLTTLNLETTHVTAAGMAPLTQKLSSARWSTVPSEAIRKSLLRLTRAGFYTAENLIKVRQDGEPLRFYILWRKNCEENPRVMDDLQTLSQAGLLHLRMLNMGFPVFPAGHIDALAELEIQDHDPRTMLFYQTPAEAESSFLQLGSVEKLTLVGSPESGPLLQDLLRFNGLREVSLTRQTIDPHLWRRLTGELNLKSVEFYACTFENIAAFEAVDSIDIQFEKCRADQTTLLLRLAPGAQIDEPAKEQPIRYLKVDPGAPRND
ncbi:leucine-rich repeat domain-containing protein [Lignipirellula cremea]|uniref:Leucine Rich repeats (2 copies) n=1 Tax=Lignipirellula cremea TaxID=2528010 RepID=A0A518E0B7_9BACT|nr:hypothetical protein [Lignipirellula cremea]QDU97523.1 Leucine Rich repeats (2 copies) [Lignipirellula cremea]